jgi:hypothetical protein
MFKTVPHAVAPSSAAAAKISAANHARFADRFADRIDAVLDNLGSRVNAAANVDRCAPTSRTTARAIAWRRAAARGPRFDRAIRAPKTSTDARHAGCVTHGS